MASCCFRFLCFVKRGLTVWFAMVCFASVASAGEVDVALENTIASQYNRALEKGDLVTLRLLIKLRPDLVNYTGLKSPRSFLSDDCDAICGHNHTSYDEDGRYYDRPLIYASRKGKVDMVKLLLEEGADVNLYNEAGVTALIQASKFGHMKIVRILLTYGADINLRDHSTDRKLSALEWAGRKGYMNIVQLLIDRGTKIHEPNQWGYTALYNFAYCGKPAVTELLLKHGARLSLSQMSSVAYYGREKTMALLVDNTNLNEEGLHYLLKELPGGRDVLDVRPKIVHLLVCKLRKIGGALPTGYEHLEASVSCKSL